LENKFRQRVGSFSEAVIMAGGLGTRLGKLTADKPKPMLDIRGRPFLSYLLDYLAFFGIEHVVLAVSYKREAIIDYFGKEYRGMAVSYYISDPPHGTGGDLIEAIKLVSSDIVVAINGDTLFDVNLYDLYSFHCQHGSVVTLSLKPMTDFDRYGVVDIDEATMRVVGFKEKAHFEHGLINGGVYSISSNVLLSMKTPNVFSFEKDFLQNAYRDFPLFGFVSDSFFIDIGTPEDYKRAQVLIPEVASKWV